MLKPFVRSQYNYDMHEVSNESSLDCSVVRAGEEVIRTKQSFAEEVDINTIVRRFGLSGELPTDVRLPSFGDFSDVHDFHSAMNAIVQARESFDAMPADVRFRFSNDPQTFVAFCSDERNADEVAKLGLVSEECLERKRKAVEAAAAKQAADAAELQAARSRRADGRFEAKAQGST